MRIPPVLTPAARKRAVLLVITLIVSVLTAVVHGGTATSTVVLITPNPAPAGTAVTVSAVVAVGATGDMSFSSDIDGPLGTGPAALDPTTGQATLTTAALTVGVHTITAAYGGDATYDPSVGTAKVTVTVGSSTGPDGHIYTANYDDGTVSVLDVQTLATTHTIPIFTSAGSGVSANPTSVILAPGNASVLVAHAFGSTVAVIETATQTVVHYIDLIDPMTGDPVVLGGDPQVSISPDASRAYLSAGDANIVVVLDISAAAVTSWATLAVVDWTVGGPTTASGYPIAFSPDGATAYVGVGAGGDPGILLIDTATYTVSGFIPTSQGVVDLAISADGSTALATGDVRALVVDLPGPGTDEGNELGAVMCGTSPCVYSFTSGVAFTSDGARALIIDGGTNELTAVDTSDLSGLALTPPDLSALQQVARGGMPIPAASQGIFAWELTVASGCAYVAAYNTAFGGAPPISGPSAVVAFNLSTGVPVYAGRAFVGNWAYQLDTYGTPTCEPAPVLASTVALEATPNPAASDGDSIVLTATVTGADGGTPIGNVVFHNEAGPYGFATLDASGQATLDIGPLDFGAHTLKASYSGDETYAGGDDTTVLLVGDPVESTTTATPSPGAAVYGEPVDVTVAVAGDGATPTGEVTLFSNGSPVSTPVTLDAAGNAVFSLAGLAVGTYSLTAAYAGDSVFLASSTAEPVTLVVERASTTTSVSASPNPALDDETVTLTASVGVVSPGSGAPSGGMTFYDGATALGTASVGADGTASLAVSTLSVGPHTIAAVYSGDDAFTGSQSDGVTLSIVPANAPPDVTAAAPTQACFWPPNHQFASVGITGITDPDGDPLTITVTRILSDEATASAPGVGGGNHAPDALGIGTPTAGIRVERSGRGDGRIYEIWFDASDGQATVSGRVKVGVPHDQRRGGACGIDSGARFDATAIN